MTLSKQQRERARSVIEDVLKQTDLHGAVDQEVQRRVRELVQESESGGGDSYSARIAGSRHQPGNVSEAGRIFARLSLVQACADDRNMAMEMAKALDVQEQYNKASQSASSAATGGLLIEEAMASDLIELLRPFSVMRRIGAMEVPIPAGNLRTPRIDVGVSSGYVAEGAAIPAGELKTGSVNMVARKLATLVVLNEELAQFSGNSNGNFSADQIITNDMMASIGQTEDTKFLRGSGTEAEPLGIVNWAADANKFNGTGDPTLANVRADLRTAEQNLLSADVPMQRPTWIMSPRTRLFLRDLTDQDDVAVFGQEMARDGTINGIPFRETNNIPNDLGSGENESLIILVDAAQVMIGDVNQLQVDRTNAATVNIDGVDTNLFETDRRALRVRRWNDIALRHNVGCAVIEGVTWGA